MLDATKDAETHFSVRADSNANLNLHAYQAHKIFNFPCAYIELQYFVLNFVLIIS